MWSLHFYPFSVSLVLFVFPSKTAVPYPANDKLISLCLPETVYRRNTASLVGHHRPPIFPPLICLSVPIVILSVYASEALRPFWPTVGRYLHQLSCLLFCIANHFLSPIRHRKYLTTKFLSLSVRDRCVYPTYQLINASEQIELCLLN